MKVFYRISMKSRVSVWSFGSPAAPRFMFVLLNVDRSVLVRCCWSILLIELEAEVLGVLFI